ncbi:MAG: porin [Actinomycetota bacterium]
MKKLMLCGTALVAAGLTCAPASASEKIKLELGGFSKWWVVGAWNDSSFQKASNTFNGSLAAVGSNTNNVDVKGDNEIWFSGTTELDNGLKVGVEVHLEAGGHTDMTSDTIDKSFSWVEGGFGKVMLGTYANGTVLLHVMAPDAAGNIGSEGLITGGFAVAQPTNVTVRQTTEIDTDDNSDKITYVSPQFHGFTVGATYVPNLREDSRYPTINSTQVYGVGGLYDNTYESLGLGVKVSGGYVMYDANPGDATSTNTGKSNEWSVGTQLAWNGFTVGGAYRKINTNFVGTINGANSAAAGTTSHAGRVWDAGIQYARDNWAVSFIHLNSQAEGDFGVRGSDIERVYQVSGKYTLGPGVDVLATAGYVTFDDERQKQSTGGDSNHNEGWTLMTGLALTF